MRRTAALLALVLLAGCAPAERIAELRSTYRATLNGWTVEQEPLAPGGGGAPLRQDVLLDVLLRHDGGAAEQVPGLSGITLDVRQLDTAEREKGRWRVWVPLPDPGLEPGRRITPRLPAVDHEPGDLFTVEVRPRVPAEERGAYREFRAPA